MLRCAGCNREFASEATRDAIEDRVGDKLQNIAPSAEENIMNYCADCRADFVGM